MNTFSKSMIFFAVLFSSIVAQAQQIKKKAGYSGNPLFPGWYADPEAIVFDKSYWIYPTFSAPYEKQVFLDAFSSKNLIKWNKHERIIDTSRVKWAKKAMWA
ncbi:MAG: arabinan endo-1,5-alpha-L-arabinosidase, partial [bacterium]